MHNNKIKYLLLNPIHRKWWMGPTTVSKHTGRWYTPHLAGIRARWLMVGPLHSTNRCPTSTGAVHKFVTFSCVFMLVQLNKCAVVCGSDLQRGRADGCLSSSILFKYERSRGHLCVLSSTRVRRVALGAVVSE